MRARLLAATASAAVVLAGCGGDGDERSQGAGSRLVDPATRPLINALERRDDGTFLLTTNRGFWRVAADGSSVRRITGARVVAPQGTSAVGTFLELADVGTGELLGSGHPDDPQALPEFLGILRSQDGGRTWNVVTRLGTADIHVIRRQASTLYLYDAVLGAVLVSDDGLRSFAERITPQQLVLDMVVDPRDGDRLLISTEQQLYRSEDQGRRWRPAGTAAAPRLAWAPSGELFRATADGTFERSVDAGDTWQRVGELPGEPWEIELQDARRMWVALADGSIAQTADGGRTWRLLFDAG